MVKAREGTSKQAGVSEPCVRECEVFEKGERVEQVEGGLCVCELGPRRAYLVGRYHQIMLLRLAIRGEGAKHCRGA